MSILDLYIQKKKLAFPTYKSSRFTNVVAWVPYILPLNWLEPSFLETQFFFLTKPKDSSD